MTAIADLVVHLISTGIPPDAVARAVELAQQHASEELSAHAEFHRNSTGIPPDTAAERRKAWDRERKRNSRKVSTGIPPDTTNDVYINTPPPTDSQSTKEGVGGGAREPSRGTRIPADWLPAEADASFADAQLGARWLNEIPKFKDYWQARAGPGAVKRDWSATWRNWIRKAAENGKINGKRTIMDAADDLVHRLREFDQPAPGGLCEPAGAPDARLLSKG